MDADLQKCLEDQDKKLDAIFRSAEKTRKYFQWTLIISIIVIVVPLIGLIFVIPAFLQNITNLTNLGL